MFKIRIRGITLVNRLYSDTCIDVVHYKTFPIILVSHRYVKPERQIDKYTIDFPRFTYYMLSEIKLNKIRKNDIT